MANERLGNKNIELLLNQYRSERKRLIFQLDNVREMITRLKDARAREVKEPAEGVVKRGPGRPRKDASLEPVKRGPGRPRKNPDAPPAKRRGKRRRKTGGYKLSPWDAMVIEAIGKEGLLPKQLIIERAKAWAKATSKKMTAAEVDAKITRVLQKLSGSRGLLGTHRTGLRRGYHYGLKEWFFASSGELRKQHQDRIVAPESE